MCRFWHCYRSFESVSKSWDPYLSININSWVILIGSVKIVSAQAKLVYIHRRRSTLAKVFYQEQLSQSPKKFMNIDLTMSSNSILSALLLLLMLSKTSSSPTIKLYKGDKWGVKSNHAEVTVMRQWGYRSYETETVQWRCDVACWCSQLCITSRLWRCLRGSTLHYVFASRSVWDIYMSDNNRSEISTTKYFCCKIQYRTVWRRTV